jgi:hypothetical protein
VHGREWQSINVPKLNENLEVSKGHLDCIKDAALIAIVIHIFMLRLFVKFVCEDISEMEG